VSEEQLVAALEAARAHTKEVGWSDVRAWSVAYEKELAAERALAKARGQQYADVTDLGVEWDTGAPCPHLLSGGGKAVVLFYARDVDPAWDGTYVTVVNPAAGQVENLGVVEFDRVSSVRIGAPNDEAIQGHPLHGRGLRAYAAHEIHNSEWLEEHILVNAVHPSHSEDAWRQKHHYLLAFHDEMVECLAGGIRARRMRAPFPEAFTELARDLLRSA
jgi:hypothetical protein